MVHLLVLHVIVMTMSPKLIQLLTTLYVQLQDGKVPNLGNKGIEFADLNVHSLFGKIDEFRHLCGSTFDLISVNETLCEHTFSDDELKLDGYSIMRHDRTRDGGGVAVYINDNKR